MEHYYGVKLPDKCTREDLLATMVKNTSDNVDGFVEVGFPLEEALRRTLASSCAGRAVWDKILS